VNYGETLRDRLHVDRVGPKLADLSRKVIAPYARLRTPLRHRTFTAWGQELPYFVHRYNVTWLNERCIEIPIAQDFLRTHNGHGLEFGNVLSHYGLQRYRIIVDKYEQGNTVTNVDILDYVPDQTFDFIVAISTLEHVGWDERDRSAEKTEAAFRHLRSMLRPNGKMLITAPLGFNPIIDAAAIEGEWHPEREACFVKDGQSGWHQEPTVHVVPWAEDDVWPPSVWVAEFAG
jgi:SAM-dependent methyltransferase